LNRREFLTQVGATAILPAVWRQAAQKPPAAPDRRGRPRSAEFVFARLRYDSGDWDYNPKVAANVLDAVLQYTDIPVYQTEVIITADSAELTAFPFVFMTGHKLVRFSAERQASSASSHGGLLFSVTAI
jgi:hypothetical protein